MSTYLTRPVFDFDLEPAKNPAERFEYNLREILLGQASPKSQPIALRAVTGIQFRVYLKDETELQRFETFIDSLKGRLNGFWLKSPFASFQILEPIGDGKQEFYIRDQQLRDAFTDHSYIVFTNRLGLTQYGRISNVELENGKERVTLYSPAITAPPPTPATSDGMDSTWQAHTLYYVRLADDSVEIEFTGDNWAFVDLKVIELPDEYAAIETGQHPVFLYELEFAGLGTPWRYTNLNANITSNGQVFTSWPILHDGHRQSLDGGENELTIQTVYDAASPVAKLFPYPTPRPLSVKVWEIAYAAPNTRTVLFTGFVDSARLDGAKAELKCATVITALGRQFPRFFIQNRCNYCLFSTHCAVVKSQWSITAVIDEVGARHVRLRTISRIRPTGYTADVVYAADLFTFGYLEHLKSAEVVAVRTIESNLVETSAKMEVVLTAPLDTTLAAIGDSVRIYPGCDGLRETCDFKFHNVANWGGFGISRQNLAIDPVEVSTTGSKK